MRQFRLSCALSSSPSMRLSSTSIRSLKRDLEAAFSGEACSISRERAECLSDLTAGAEGDLCALSSQLVVRRGHEVDSIPDLVEYVLRRVPLSVAQQTTKGIDPGEANRRIPLLWEFGDHGLPPIQTESDIIDFFLGVWLPEMVRPTTSSSIGSSNGDVEILDIIYAVEAMAQFIEGRDLDNGRCRTRPLPSLWTPQSLLEERAAASFLYWIEDERRRLDCGAEHCDAVLEVGSGSGHVTDLLLKSGSRHVLAVDHDITARLATESTIRQHFASRRSSGSSKDRVLETASASLLPKVTPPVVPTKTAAAVKRGHDGAVGSVALAAATKRRKLARAHRSGAALCSNPAEALSTVTAKSFSAIAHHMSPCRLPLSVDAWWSMRQQAPHRSVYACASALHNVLRDSQEFLQSSADSWLLLLLPDRFDVSAAAIESESRSPMSCVEEYVASHQGDGVQMVHSVRHSLQTPATVEKILRSKTVTRLLQNRGLKSSAAIARLEQEVRVALESSVGLNFCVLQKRPTLRHSLRDKGVIPRVGSADWRDTFEYDNYLPKSGPENQIHWTSQVPTFDYLAPEEAAMTPLLQTPDPALRQRILQKRNDRSAALGRSVHADAVNDAAVQRFGSLFGHELRAKRAQEAKKLLFATKERLEWQLDEKIVQSEAAKVQVINEVLKKLSIKTPD